MFVPGLADPAAIEALVGRLRVPLNILHSPAGLPLSRLADLGVARVSLGSLLYRAALAAAVQTAVAVREGGAGPVAGAVPAYAAVAALHLDDAAGGGASGI